MALTSINFPSSAAPDVLYHYTRLDAFMSIVARRVLEYGHEMLCPAIQKATRYWILDCLQALNLVGPSESSGKAQGTREHA
jgi:hypothetical protein